MVKKTFVMMVAALSLCACKGKAQHNEHECDDPTHKHEHNHDHHPEPVQTADRISWIPFTWGATTVGSQTLPYTFMDIAVQVDGIEKMTHFQLDLGSSNTVIYENPLNAVLGSNPYPFGISNQCQGGVCPIEGIHITINKYHFHSLQFLLVKGAGDKKVSADFPRIGTLGVDFLRKGYFIIDYKDKQVGFVREMSDATLKNITFVDFEYSDMDQINFKVKVNGKDHKAMFDTGAGSWTLLTPKSKVAEVFGVNAKATGEQMKLPMWGFENTVQKVSYSGKVEVAGQTINIPVAYSYEDNEVSDFLNQGEISLIVGNEFFQNRKIIIDYQNKRFGIME